MCMDDLLEKILSVYYSQICHLHKTSRRSVLALLLGGLGLLITLNLLIIRIVQAIKFQINKRKAVEDLADKFISKLEAEYEALEGKIRSKIFSLESLAYSEGCKKQFLESKNEMKELRVNVVAHFK